MLKRILCVVTMTILLTGYLFFLKWYEKEEANEVPEIVFDMEHLELSVKDDESALLEGVHAYDEEDGDLSDQIIIDSLSEFDVNKYRTVKYIVFDSNNKAATAMRTISYTDYTPPRITLSDSLVQSSLSETKLNNMAGAISSVDGDISSYVEIQVGSMDDNKLEVKISARDSTGTESYLPVSYDHDQTAYLMKIQLKQYVMYVAPGSTYDLGNNISGVMMGNTSRPEFIGAVTVRSDVDFNKPGIYDVYYTLDIAGEGSARTKGIIVVE